VGFVINRTVKIGYHFGWVVSFHIVTESCFGHQIKVDIGSCVGLVVAGCTVLSFGLLFDYWS